MLKKPLILGCGALNWDIFYAVKDLERFSFEGMRFIPGEEYVLPREAFLELLKKLQKEGLFLYEGGGGSSANTIFALATWGFSCGFIGALGEDTFGEKILKEFSKVNLKELYLVKAGQTSLALILLDDKRDRAIVVSPGSAEMYLSIENLKVTPFKGAILHLSSFASKEGEAFQKELISTFEGEISLDPGEIYAEKGKAFLATFLKKTKYLFLTEKELKRAELSTEELLESGIRYLFIKMGKRGALALTQNLSIRSSVFPAKEIVDNTGAGDYFNAGVLAGLLVGLSLEKALELGLYSASISLRDFGRKGILSQSEFKNFLSRLK